MRGERKKENAGGGRGVRPTFQLRKKTTISQATYWQFGNLKLAIRVLQLKMPLDFRYSVV